MAAPVRRCCSRSTASRRARAAGEVLKVCLDEDLPPLSAHHRGKPDSGFDVALAEAIADRLGRPLKIQWFESKLDEDSSPALEANALLSDGRCSLVGGYALTKDSLVVPGVKTAKLPDFEGATTRRSPAPRAARRARAKPALHLFAVDGRAWPSKAREPPHRRHRRSCRAAHRHRKRDARRRDSDEFDKGRLIDNITHLVPGRDDLLGALDRGDFDATLLDLRRFDAYRAAHPDSKLAASGYYYPIGANRGYVGACQRPGPARRGQQGAHDLQAEEPSRTSAGRPASPICRPASRRSSAISGKRSFKNSRARHRITSADPVCSNCRATAFPGRPKSVWRNPAPASRPWCRHLTAALFAARRQRHMP